MRLLYVTNGFPYPLTSGYLRHYFLIRELSARHAITLCSIVGADHRPDYAEALTPYTERIETFPSTDRSPSRWRKVRSRLGALGGTGAEGPAGRLGRAAAALGREEPFDALVLSGKRTFAALRPLGDLPLVADVCDTASARIRGSMRFAPRRRLPLLALQAHEVRRVERGLAAAADVLLFASPRDRDLLLGDVDDRGVAHRATVVPNGVDIDYWKRTAPTLGPSTIVFTGKMDYPPNEDAALLLADRVLPAVRRAMPDAELCIVGRDPTRRLLAAATRDGVTVTGEVPDIRPYLDRAAVFAAPLRFGAGIQNKILEAMAMEIPVVTSPLGADGLRTPAGRAPLAVAASPDELATRVVELLRAARADASPVHEARAYVAENFVWAASAAKLEDALAAAVSRRLDAPGLLARC